jgi:hypothetical protein
VNPEVGQLVDAGVLVHAVISIQAKFSGDAGIIDLRRFCNNDLRSASRADRIAGQSGSGQNIGSPR